VTCVLERAASHYTTKQELSAAGKKAGELLPLKKPDVDNVAKLVLDALEGYAYAADAAICNLTVNKEWGTPARTIVTVAVA